MTTFRVSKATRGALGALMIGSLVVAGCASQPGGGSSNFGQVTLTPGATALCYTDPCTVMFQMPAGSGSYTVRANNQVVGTYPAGQLANLGGFFRNNSPFTITVDGTNAKPAIFYVQGNM